MRLVILDGRWIGFLSAEVVGVEERYSVESAYAKNFESALRLPSSVMLHEAMEIVSAIMGMQTPQGMVQIRQCNIYPLTMTTGPKELPVKWSTLLFVDELEDEERKQIDRAYVQAVEHVKLERARQRSGLVI